MVYILGKHLKDKHPLKWELSKLRGIQKSTPLKIFSDLELNPRLKTHELTHLQIRALLNFLQKNVELEQDLYNQVYKNIKNLVRLGCHKGIRHVRKLPVRGQRTRTNANTVARQKKAL